jgi:aspartate 1-decarboxylase
MVPKGVGPLTARVPGAVAAAGNERQETPGRAMFRTFLNAKIRDIRITATHLEYEGSMTLDEDWLERAGILPNEEVQVLNLENGERFTTYAILGARGSGAAELNGPAAHLGKVGDRVMVLSYAILHTDEIPGHEPVIVSVDPDG